MSSGLQVWSPPAQERPHWANGMAHEGEQPGFALNNKLAHQGTARGRQRRRSPRLGHEVRSRLLKKELGVQTGRDLLSIEAYKSIRYVLCCPIRPATEVGTGGWGRISTPPPRGARSPGCQKVRGGDETFSPRSGEKN